MSRERKFSGLTALDREAREVQGLIAHWPTSGASRDVMEGTVEHEKITEFFLRWDLNQVYESSFRFLSYVLEHSSQSYGEWINCNNPTHGRRWSLAERRYFLHTHTVREGLINAVRRQFWGPAGPQQQHIRRVANFMHEMELSTTIERYR